MALEIESLHFYPLENAAKHHTDRFEIIHSEPRVPVIRRGQSFIVAIRFQNRSYIPKTDNIKFIFNCGSTPNALRGTKSFVSIIDKNEQLEPTKWAGKITSNVDKVVTIELITPSDTVIGPWEVVVECQSNSGKTSLVFDGDFWILFNPWEKSDLCYMPEVALLDEYILSDVGKIWVGPWGSSRGREWVFGQFDSCVLPACILMLDRANVSHQNRGDPITLARAISRIVNSNDDHGVLVGRWDGNYVDGRSPSSWTGSIDILDQFLNTETEVQYGQCWVFAGVVTTVCRALGIPSRVVSNLVSAHDSNGTLTIDKYYDANNHELDYDPNNPMGEDSIWNYHVWNDVYMARPDLPTGYGGWQAVDATPQETSSGLYQCGPASLEAIKQGAVGYNYDVPFLISSVNADFMKWKEDPNSEIGYRRIECKQNHVGKMILTKMPYIFDPNGDKDREDITNQYKPKEGSKEERSVLYNAVRNTARAKRFYDVPESINEDVDFQLMDLERINIGMPFVCSVKVKNNSDQIRTIEASLSAGSIYYTGIKANTVKTSSGEVKIKPNSVEDVRMTVRADDYIDGLVEYSIMKISALCTVKETKQMWAGEDDFQVVKPNIVFKGPNEMSVNEEAKFTLGFKNPLNKTLTGCEFNISGPGVIPKTMFVPYRDVRPNETFSVVAPLLTRNAGEFKLVATFTSRELSDITGSAKLEVF